MKRISRFIGKKISIDDKVGTIRSPEQAGGRCEFIYRDGNAIVSVKIAARYLVSAGDRYEYAVREKYRPVIDRLTETHNEFVDHWSGSYPNGEFIRREWGLKSAGI